jgi:hypothetical protein
VNGATWYVPASLLADSGARIVAVGINQRTLSSWVRVHVLADNFNRHGAHMGIGVFMQYPQCLGKHLNFTGAAGPLLAAVAGKCVQCGLTNQGIGIAQHADQIAERLWNQEVI